MPRPIDVVRAALERHGSSITNTYDGFMAQCPVHEDRSASLGVKEGNEGRVMLNCYADCDRAEIVSALGLEWGDLFESNGNGHHQITQAREVAHYDYHDEHGQPLFQVVRFEPKSFRQKRWTGSRYEWGMADTRRVLYRLPRVLEALARHEWIFLCEGEKDVHAVEAAGYTATTMPGGAGKWKDEYTQTLAMGRVIIIMDNDDPGRRHAFDVARRLHGHVSRVAVRAPADGHKDIADHLAAGLTMKQLQKQTVLEDLPVHANGNGNRHKTPNTALLMTARAFCSRPAPEKSLQLIGPAVVRQQRITIGAQTGEGKTTLGCQIVRSVVTGEPFLQDSWRGMGGNGGGKALIIDVEQGEETVKSRFREAGLAELDAVDLLWQPAGFAFDRNPEDVALVYQTLKDGGYDVVLADPLYQLHQGDQNSERTAADLMRILDGWAREFNCAIIIPMHARKPHPQAGYKQFSMNDIGGNGAWVRNAEVVLGLQFAHSGSSRLWFFKDRDGGLPPVRTWWGLTFDRAAGFTYTAWEKRVAAVDRVKALIDTDEGVSWNTLKEALHDVKPNRITSALGELGAHQLGDRWRLTAWHEQTTLDA